MNKKIEMAHLKRGVASNAEKMKLALVNGFIERPDMIFADYVTVAVSHTTAYNIRLYIRSLTVSSKIIILNSILPLDIRSIIHHYSPLPICWHGCLMKGDQSCYSITEHVSSVTHRLMEHENCRRLIWFHPPHCVRNRDIMINLKSNTHGPHTCTMDYPSTDIFYAGEVEVTASKIIFNAFSAKITCSFDSFKNFKT
mmetsp:Transcript_27965/g.59644  ORF Transcript_27965/g.59644 Transcript_27965/m.59644 type:complete len:197 (+) Transcript_27965:386-976(+)